MELNLAAWYYRNLLGKNEIIENPEFYEINLLDGSHQFESSVLLKSELRPTWLENSSLYRNTDGSGTSKFKNIAIYKGISEALERWAFYELIDTNPIKFKFDCNPTTTGMAAFPHFNTKIARQSARDEAIERWAIHQFNRSCLPIKIRTSKIIDLRHFEIIVPFNNVSVSLLEYWNGSYYSYGFAAGEKIEKSYYKSLIELNRNIRVLEKTSHHSRVEDFKTNVDKTLFYFSTINGNEKFNELINLSPHIIKNNNPHVICDQEMIGGWTKYTKVWRYLLEDSYYNPNESYSFFMF